MVFKSEVLGLVFGVLLILVTFGDSHFKGAIAIGNLDTIFGLTLWPLMDIIYPLASLAVFLLYGWSKRGSLKVSAKTTLLFASFVLALALMNLDDLAIGVGHQVSLSVTYWTAISWIFPVYSVFTFLLFGKLHEEKRYAVTQL